MQQDDIDPAAQARLKTEREELEKLNLQRDIEDVVWLMSERAGRRIMYALLEEAGVYRGSYTGTQDTVFNEGKRAVGLKYLGIVNSRCAEQFVLMLKEHQEDADRSRPRRR